jgi:peptide/nickel transport system ATP-binding protein
MGVIRQICQRLYVMHRGRIVEQADTETVIQAPRHPYTQRLLSCLPERMALVTEKRT